MSETLAFFVTAPKGITPTLLDELRSLGIEHPREQPAGAQFHGTLEQAYRVCLWSRTANRVLMPLTDFYAPDETALYDGVKAIPWEDHLTAGDTLAVDFTSSRSRLSHTRYGAQKVKDAVVDRFRERFGERPSVDLQTPSLRINCYLQHDQAHIYIDLAGDSLHRRGYRARGVQAPLKENLAAAILLRSGWPAVAEGGGALVDPLCGSATLCIEAAMIAADMAPGLLRDYYGFLGWQGHVPALWRRLLDEAEDRFAVRHPQLPPIFGFDRSHQAIEAARLNARQAGLGEAITLECRRLEELKRPEGLSAPGLVVANPPYGERIGAEDGLVQLYGQLGDKLRGEFAGWKAAVFTGNPELGHAVGLRARKVANLYNGPIECRLLQFDVDPRWYASSGPSRPALLARARPGAGTEMFVNRLRKNLKTLGKWARREGIDCFRVYDADMPEFALAVDIYQGEQRWVHVQEYAPPPSIAPEKARERLEQALAGLPEALEVPVQQIFFKVRQRQKGSAQYEKLADSAEFHEVRENGCRLLVNFADYLDTGLFLDHRQTRALVGELSREREVLNLFAYTGSASVYAAHGGARGTTTVDMSRTYLDWAKRNMALNGFTGAEHRFVQADCLRWLREDAPGGRRFGLVFLDPPTFSSSKRMAATFDVQRDHVSLIHDAMAVLVRDGDLIFSNNNRRFKMDTDALGYFLVEDISAATLPRDFARNPRIHNCWRVRHRP